jgi:adenylate kinase family enzyme
MPARRIHIIGGPGSGKTSVATRLSEITGTPITDLDDIFWDRGSSTYGVRATPASRDAALGRVLARPDWIIEGVYHSWLGRSFAESELVILLNVSVVVRDLRILWRFAKRKLGLVPSKKETGPDLLQLLRWNHQYDSSNLASARLLFATLGREPIECTNASEVLRAAGYAV